MAWRGMPLAIFIRQSRSSAMAERICPFFRIAAEEGLLSIMPKTIMFGFPLVFLGKNRFCRVSSFLEIIHCSDDHNHKRRFSKNGPQMPKAEPAKFPLQPVKIRIGDTNRFWLRGQNIITPLSAVKASMMM